jgi:carbon storage regulator
MLVLGRNVGERIIIDNDIVIEILSIVGSRVKIGIAAPKEVPIVRGELLEQEAAK